MQFLHFLSHGKMTEMVPKRVRRFFPTNHDPAGFLGSSDFCWWCSMFIMCFGYNISEFSDFPDFRISGFPDFHEIRKSRFPGIRNSGIPGVRVPRFPDTRKSGLPDFRKSGFPEFRIFGYVRVVSCFCFPPGVFLRMSYLTGKGWKSLSDCRQSGGASLKVLEK